MFENAKNSKSQGDIGLGIAISYFVKCGYTVSIPLTDSQDYDLITDINGKLCKIQVKTTSFKKNNNYCVDLRVKGGNKSGTGKIKLFDKNTVDYIFILTSENCWYLIPSNIVGNTISLCDKYEKFKCN